MESPAKRHAQSPVGFLGLPRVIWGMILRFLYVSPEQRKIDLFVVCRYFIDTILTCVLTDGELSKALTYALEHGYIAYFERYKTSSYAPKLDLIQTLIRERRTESLKLALDQSFWDREEAVALVAEEPELHNVFFDFVQRRGNDIDLDYALGYIYVERKGKNLVPLFRRLVDMGYYGVELFKHLVEDEQWDLILKIFDKVKRNMGVFTFLHECQSDVKVDASFYRNAGAGDLLASSLKYVHLDAFKMLLDRRAAVDLVNVFKEGVVPYSCERSRGPLLKLLLCHPMMPSGNGDVFRVAFCICCKLNDVEAVEVLLNDNRLELDADWSCECIKASIEDALLKGEVRTPALDVLLNHAKVDPSGRNNEALEFALSKGRWNDVLRILDHPQVDPNIRNHAVLKAAFKSGDSSILHHVLQNPRLNISDDMESTIESARCHLESLIYMVREKK